LLSNDTHFYADHFHVPWLNFSKDAQQFAVAYWCRRRNSKISEALKSFFKES
jgi:hypothetical protein